MAVHNHSTHQFNPTCKSTIHSIPKPVLCLIHPWPACQTKAPPSSRPCLSSTLQLLPLQFKAIAASIIEDLNSPSQAGLNSAHRNQEQSLHPSAPQQLTKPAPSSRHLSQARRRSLLS
ncbi:hypothetical protein M0R45_000550 [Rubus argutus]|uniref:Uncharacterized protein n=1 Tax=Rubus argutus TaxID=59490 RepID=A0AAW1VNZ3_RUBAR